MKSKIAQLFLVLLVTSCGVDQTEYANYIMHPDNGLIVKNGSVQSSYQLMYCPVDLMVARELQQTDKSKRQLRSEFGNEDYFLFEVNKSHGNIDDKQSFYYSYLFEKDIFQIVEGDTLRPSLYQLEQGINGSQSLRINLAFPSIRNDRQLYINDKYGLQTSLTIAEAMISNLPKLRI